MSIRFVSALLLTVVGAQSVWAQKAPTVPIHPLGAVAATSTMTFQALTQLRVLSDGRVLVNDPAERRVILLDTKLASPIAVLDSIPGKDRTYMTGTMILPYYGDSSLVFDRNANAFVVVDPQGKLGKVLTGPLGTRATTPAAARGAAPPGGGAAGGAAGPPSSILLPAAANLVMTFSPPFGILYSLRKAPLIQYPMSDVARPLAGEPDVVRKYEDSANVVSLNPTTRQSDTLFRISTGNQVIRTLRPAGGNANTVASMFPFADEVAVMHDGTLAVFRSRDYRIEWLTSDGKTASSPRMPYDWQQMTDRLKAHIVDSVNAGFKADYEDQLALIARDSATFRARMLAVGRKPDSNDFRVPPPPVFDGAELPDFLPPTSRGAVLADADNRVWIRRNVTAGVSASAAIAYDVIDRQGKVVERVSVPVGETIMGFAPGFAYVVRWDAGIATLTKRKLK